MSAKFKITTAALKEQLERAMKQRAEWKARMLDFHERAKANYGTTLQQHYDKQYRAAATHYEQWCMTCDSLNAQIKRRQETAKGTVVYGQK